MEREADYAAQREREWEQALAQEAEHHRYLYLCSMMSLGCHNLFSSCFAIVAVCRKATD